MTALQTLSFPNAVPQELATVGDWWRFALSSLNRADAQFGQGTADAAQDAAFLVLGALNLPLGALDTLRDLALTGFERKHLFNALRMRVIDRVPTAYILGFTEQMGRRFEVNENVLIPRSFFGELLEQELAPWVVDAEAITDVLDLCTGSGCLAVLAAQAFPYAQVMAADISAPALEVAQRNVAHHKLDDAIELFRGDLFDALPADSRFDLIISNPPYVTAESMAALPQEFRAEPALALAAGLDGNDVVRRILAEAGRFLKPNGLLLVDVGHNRDLVEAAFPRYSFTWLDTEQFEAGVFLLKAEELA